MMHKQLLKITLTTLILTLSPGSAPAQTSSEPLIDPEMVGSWELISLIERGVDVTGQAGVIGGENLYVYTFMDDGTFSITEGGRWFESGTWAVDRDTQPMQFDHVPLETSDTSEYIGEISLGIYEMGKDIAKICIADESPDERPRSFDTNSCLMFILRRVRSD